MVKRSIVHLLLLSLMAPLSSGAAAWMSVSMSEQGESHAMRGSVTADGNQASSSDDHLHPEHSMRGDGLPNAQLQGSDHPHDGHYPAHSHDMQSDENPHDQHGASQLHDTHSKADCESECLSCINHCTTLALLSQSCDSESKNRAPASSPTHPLSSLAELLLRPPILV
jgi:hypothetical protein